MNLDRTFCSGVRCTKALTCDRWTHNLEQWAEDKGIDLNGRRISVAEFGDINGKCNMYSPIEPTPQPSAKDAGVRDE